MNDPLAVLGLTYLLHTSTEMRVCGSESSFLNAKIAFERFLPEVVFYDPLMEGGQPCFNLIKDFIEIRRESRVIVLTSENTPYSVQYALRAGASAYFLRSDPWEDMLGASLGLATGLRHVGPGVSRMLAERLAIGSLEMLNEPSSVLSNRELEVYRLLSTRDSIKDIAYRLGVSVKTVETNQKRIKQKLGLATVLEVRTSAIKYMKEGLLEKGKQDLFS